MFTDFVAAPNIGSHPDTYELENQALARDGRLHSALRALWDWRGATVLDIGTGTGFWLTHYDGARRVVGVEPDPALLSRARERVSPFQDIEAVAGSAECLPFDDDTFDLAHVRWAYFFGPGAEAGLAEAMRVLRPGGCLIVVDNSWNSGDFAELLEDATGGNADHDSEATDLWWAARGAHRHEVLAGWQADSAHQLEQILRIEFPAETIDRFVARHQGASLTYAMALYVLEVSREQSDDPCGPGATERSP